MNITEPQKKVIRYIEENLGIKFIGINSKDAQQFISHYMDISKFVYDKYRKIGLSDETGEDLYLDDVVTYNGNQYIIKYEIGAYMLVKDSDVDLYEEFNDCWNDDIYPLAQLYWNTGGEDGCVNGLIKIKEGNNCRQE